MNMKVVSRLLTGLDLLQTTYKGALAEEGRRHMVIDGSTRELSGSIALDRVGEQPVQRIETVEIPPEAYDAVRKMLEDA